MTMIVRNAALLLLTSTLACADHGPSRVLDPDAAASMGTHAVVAQVNGSGHIDRSMPDDRAVRAFTISAVGRADGSASGCFNLNVGPGALRLSGAVTCVTVIGNRAWVGGQIDVNPFPFPVFAAVMEFVDHGTAPADPHNATDGDTGPEGRDEISVIGFFGQPGDNDLDWCATPVEGPVMEIDFGNITIR
jgi:hypothetical protein